MTFGLAYSGINCVLDNSTISMYILALVTLMLALSLPPQYMHFASN